MIDIKTLKQYPLSFSLLEKWVEQKHTTALALLLDKVTNEELVEFLDELSIYTFEAYDEGNNRWTWVIWNKHDDALIEDSMLSTFKIRKEATESAIQKAFEILEQKLKLN